VIAHVVFLTALQVCGALLLGLVRRRVPLAFGCLSGVLWGQALWVLLGLTVLSVGIPFTVWTMGAGLALLVAGLLWGNLRVGRFTRAELGWLVGSTAVVAVVAGMAGCFNVAVATYDSYAQLGLARHLSYVGGFDPEVHATIANWGIFLLIVQGAAEMVGVEYLWGLGTATYAAFLATFGWLTQRVLRSLELSRWVASGLAVLAVVLVGSTYFLTFQAAYVHNSLLSMAFVTLAAGALWLAAREERVAWLLPFGLAVVSVGLLRVEAPLVGAVLVLLALGVERLPQRARATVGVVYAVVIAAWYVRLIPLIDVGTHILTPKRALVVVGAMGALAAVSVLSGWRVVKWLVGWGPLLVVGGLALVVVAAGARDPAHLAVSVQAMATNLLVAEEWGWTGWLLLTAVCLVAVLPRLPRGYLLSTVVAAFVLLTVALGMFRNPYRIGWGDSANRMLTHVVPVLVLYLVARYGQVLRGVGLQAAFTRQRGVAAGCLGVAALVGGVWLMGQPVNVAREADVLVAPPTREGYSFAGLLKGDGGQVYAASQVTGPGTLLLALPEAIGAKSLEVVQYDEGQAWVDFAWHVSADLRSWETVFDTRSPEEGIAAHVDDVTWRFDLSRVGAFRYVRLTMRVARGQDRLLLRGLRVYAREGWFERPVVAGLPELGGVPEEESAEDAAWGAVVVDGPRFVAEAYADQLFDGRVTKDCVTAVEAGPGSMVVDLGWATTARWLELTGCPDGPMLTGLAWAVSADGADWRPVAAEEVGTVGEAGATRLFEAEVAEPYRFLKLGYVIPEDAPLQLRELRVLEQRPRRFTVVQAPPMHAGHGVEVALRLHAGARRSAYVAARAAGPATVVLDGGVVQTAEWLEFVEYDEALAWTDYAWHASVDGKLWVTIFDTRKPAVGEVEEVDAITRRFGMGHVGAFRYLRVTFRAGLDQNRLLLRAVRVLPAYVGGAE
jgi:hypothetical protein